jgi:ribonuclease T1
MRRRPNVLVWIAVVIAIAVAALWEQRDEARTHKAKPAVSSRLESVVHDAGERDQIAKTLALIERGGPFPYPKDGTTFMNREGKLPDRARGYWREYTVPTPGAGTRGARRIVRGKSGETYYTNDHYRTFVRIDR